MNEINYKQGKIVRPTKEFLIVQNTLRYEINGIDMSKAVVLYKKELEIFEPMPKGDYRIIMDGNIQFLEITNQDIFKDYLAIQIISITELLSSMYEPTGDIDINTMLHEMNNAISDIHALTEYLKKTNLMVDSEKSTNVFPDLPIGSTVVKMEDGKLGALPVNDLYEHFDRLTQRIYDAVKADLEVDYQTFRNGLLQYSQELEVAIKGQIDIYVTNAFQQFDQKVTESENEIIQKGEEILEQLGQFDPTGLVQKVADLENTRVIRTGDQMTGNLAVANPLVAGDGVLIGTAGYISCKKTGGNPNISFQTGVSNGYVGALHTEGAIVFQNHVGGAFFKLYNNGSAEINTAAGESALILKNQKNVALNWWTASRIVFNNDNKEAVITGLGNQGMFVFYTPLNQFPVFRMINGATGTAYDVNVANMHKNVLSIKNTYFNRTTGGTIGGAVDVQGGHSANSYYSRGTISAVGAVSSSNNVVAYSDRRLKKDLNPFENALDTINQINLYRYKWKDTDKEDIGVVAQEVEKVLPEFVVDIQDAVKGTVKTVDYGKLATICLQGIKELQEANKKLTDEINKLKGVQNDYITQNR